MAIFYWHLHLKTLSQVKTVPLNKHPSFPSSSSSANSSSFLNSSSSFLTLPRNSRKNGGPVMKMVPAYDGSGWVIHLLKGSFDTFYRIALPSPPGPRTSADGFSCSSRRADSPSMSMDNVPNVPPPAMFSSSSDHQSNKFINFGCAECEGQAEHERIKSLLKQKKGKGGKHPKLTENPDSSQGSMVDKEVVWTKSSYSTLPNPRSRGQSVGSLREKQSHHQEQPGSQV